MMVMHRGLKVNPLHIEMRLLTRPALDGCLVIGTGYTQCGLLIDPKDYSLSTESIIELLWSKVEEANATVPQHAWAQKDLIVVATKDRPFPKAAKGTIIRTQAIKLYEGELRIFLVARRRGPRMYSNLTGKRV
jgi:hypothetical protein